MMPHHSRMPMWKSIKVHISSMSKHWFQFLPCWEKHFLSVSHDILLFVSIYKLTSQIFCPSVIHHTSIIGPLHVRFIFEFEGCLHLWGIQVMYNVHCLHKLTNALQV